MILSSFFPLKFEILSYFCGEWRTRYATWYFPGTEMLPETRMHCFKNFTYSTDEEIEPLVGNDNEAILILRNETIEAYSKLRELNVPASGQRATFEFVATVHEVLGLLNCRYIPVQSITLIPDWGWDQDLESGI